MASSSNFVIRLSPESPGVNVVSQLEFDIQRKNTKDALKFIKLKKILLLR